MEPKNDAAEAAPSRDVRARARYMKDGDTRTYSVHAMESGSAEVWVRVDTRNESSRRKLVTLSGVALALAFLDSKGQELLAEGFSKLQA
jgi:hypothetical protein